MKKNLLIGIIAIVIILAGGGVWYLQSTQKPPDAPLKEVSLASGVSPGATLLWIASDQGYFARHGLNVTFKDYPISTVALQDIFNGNLDFIRASEYVISEPLLDKKPLRIIGTIAEAETVTLVGRRDRGIFQISDLEQKRIGLPKGSISEYYLARFFILNGLSLRNATVINLQPAELVDAIVRGDIDAAIDYEPYVYQIQQQIGENVVVWPANLGQPAYYSIVCNETTLRERPEIAEGLLASLLEAETYVSSHPEEAKKIAQKQTNYDDQYMNNEWEKYHFSVTLSQSLITSMEDETRWKIRNNLTAATKVPDFSNYISYDTLYRLKPSAVTIIR